MTRSGRAGMSPTSPAFEPADRGEHADRVGRVGPMEAIAASMTATFRTRPASSGRCPARDVDSRPAGECRDDCCRCRRIADPHLARITSRQPSAARPDASLIPTSMAPSASVRSSPVPGKSRVPGRSARHEAVVRRRRDDDAEVDHDEPSAMERPGR